MILLFSHSYFPSLSFSLLLSYLSFPNSLSPFLSLPSSIVFLNISYSFFSSFSPSISDSLYDTPSQTHSLYVYLHLHLPLLFVNIFCSSSCLYFSISLSLLHTASSLSFLIPLPLSHMHSFCPPISFFPLLSLHLPFSLSLFLLPFLFCSLSFMFSHSFTSTLLSLPLFNSGSCIIFFFLPFSQAVP